MFNNQTQNNGNSVPVIESMIKHRLRCHHSSSTHWKHPTHWP